MKTILEKSILSGLCLMANGFIDLPSYDKYLSGDLQNYSLTDADIQKNLDALDK